MRLCPPLMILYISDSFEAKNKNEDNFKVRIKKTLLFFTTSEKEAGQINIFA